MIGRGKWWIKRQYGKITSTECYYGFAEGLKGDLLMAWREGWQEKIYINLTHRTVMLAWFEEDKDENAA